MKEAADSASSFGLRRRSPSSYGKRFSQDSQKRFVAALPGSVYTCSRTQHFPRMFWTPYALDPSFAFPQNLMARKHCPWGPQQVCPFSEDVRRKGSREGGCGTIPGMIRCMDGSLIAIITHKGESGYPLESWCLTPVPGHPPKQTAEGMYNTAHAAMRSVVERSIRLLKSRFHCRQRYRTLLYEAERAANIVAACAVLHNLRLSEGNVEDSDGSDDDSRSSSSSSELDSNGDSYHTVCPETGGLD
ncbi:hypothetical protein HPB49_003806 [Dermacentor silvarum]|uniref:Uncharacterized protein n=1 Tax=Dermacentor silvarum TaxID=543639 RepID=A0ACB8D311_DERSI|nr:hypothetical protein HPB49_003806 [Dermacentor silvarum]